MLIESIRLPISDAAPCGADIRYDEDFEALKAEIGKQSAVGARTDFDRLVQRGNALVSRGPAAGDGAGTLVEDQSGIDFDRVVALATGILSRKAKDLQVAGYLCLGSLRTGGYAGLADALDAYQALLETWWDGLFPEARRLEGRRLAISWLAQRVSEAVAMRPPDPEDGPALERAIAACRAVDAFVREKIAENPPTLSALARALKEHQEALPSAAAPARPAASESVASAAAAPSAPAPAAAPAPALSAPASADDALLVVSRAADLLRAASPESPLGYRLLRCARWDRIDALPPHQGGKTLIPPPEEHFKMRLAALAAMPPGAESLAGCEELFYEAPNHYRLELQRLADQALGALGASHAGARRALRHDLALLLLRLPGIESLAFSDGTPFADPATRDWIEREIRPLTGAGASAPAPAAGGAGADDALAEELAEADTLAGDGDLAGSLEKLQAGQTGDPRARTRFLRQLHMARLCLNGNQVAIARPLLEDLDRQIERFGLARWEPELCGRTWSLLQRCYQHLLQGGEQEPGEIQKRMDRVFHKLCRLDVRAALSEGGRR